ncbi:putative membrane protein YhdT [Bradyrhizobium sp. USDA 4011]|jgi:hypothetical protein|nr:MULTISPECIES: acyltransferase [Bradyrhizobium]MDX3970339.1 acyltransferase [Bradyrhizobium sp.]RTM15556.1 MAG: acyltransferase [Bradyrhizobiaceae bacterium]
MDIALLLRAPRSHAEPENNRAIRQVTVHNAAIDRVRALLMLLVLLHHAVIPYTYFGGTDAEKWIGFDTIVLANDSFFMAMFFFLSGLFVWPGLAHKAAPEFLSQRLVRLGLPFVIAVFTIIPLAYYALELRQTPDISFGEFWLKTITVGPWPSGPVWFLWVLLACDVVACALSRVAPRLLDPVNLLSVRSYDRPHEFFAILVVITGAAYIPLRVYFGAGHWFEFGPLSVQASRVLLYPSYFFLGAAVGAANLDRGLLGTNGQLQRSRLSWALAAIVTYCLLWVLIYVKREHLGNPVWLPAWYEVSYGFLFVVFSAAIMFALLGHFLRLNRSALPLLDSIRPYAYGMFLVHYPIVLWIQYGLFDVDLDAIAKALITFVLAVLLSLATTAVLRALPGAQRVL